ncbi:hypothetical protein MPSEU_000833600 [Mayamaea pseudoterrestris]|nr:hypothetical protein MPSEU_000833600 [Mayamaea pseudoterrestris]
MERFLRKPLNMEQQIDEASMGTNHTLSNFVHAVSPLAGLIRSYPNSMHHDPYQKRRCLAFTAVPKEVSKLFDAIEKDLLSDQRLSSILDCIHVTIPDRSMRYSTNVYPSTRQLQQLAGKDPRIIITRTSFDYGPMTRYLGPLHYEKNDFSTMILFDVDTDLSQLLHRPHHDLALLYLAAESIDRRAMWCWQGENFVIDNENVVHPAWDTFALHQVTRLADNEHAAASVGNIKDDASINSNNNATASSLAYNECHFCRGVGGLVFKPLHFRDFWWNQSDYHESCFWDDDRWVSYQMERQHVPLKVLHYNATKQMQLAMSTARQVPVESSEERQRKMEEAILLENRKQGNGRQRLQGRQKLLHLRNRERLRQVQMAAQQAMLKEEQAKHDAILAGDANMDIAAAADDNDVRWEEAKDNSKSSVDDHAHNEMRVVATGNSRKGDGISDGHDKDEKGEPSGDTAFTVSQVDDGAEQMHRRLGSLTQITNSLLSDQTCPLAWLSNHPEAYPSARINRKDPKHIPPPPEDLALLRVKLKRHGRLVTHENNGGAGSKRIASLLRERAAIQGGPRE